MTHPPTLSAKVSIWHNPPTLFAYVIFEWSLKTLAGRQSNKKKKCSNFVSKRTKVNIKKCFCSKQNSSFLSKNVNYNSILRSVLDIYRNIKEKLEKLILKMNLNFVYILELLNCARYSITLSP